jgi:DNA polymerase-4
MSDKSDKIGFLNLSPLPILYELATNPELNRRGHLFFGDEKEGVPVDGKDDPFVIVGSVGNRGLLVAVSSEAYRAGIRAGITPDIARRFMPGLKIVEERPAAYFEAAETVLSISERFVPVVDVEKQDAFALDLTGTDRLYPDPIKLLRALQGEIRKEINLPSRAGLGVSRLVARLASMRAGEKGIVEVPVGQEGEFLADYHVGVLPGVGVQIAKRLQWLGVHTVRELAMVPVQTLEAAFGPKGLEIARAATGHDPRPRRKPEQIKPIKREIALEQIIYDPKEIRAALRKLVAGIGLDLRKMGMRVRTIGLEIRYPDIPPHRRKKSIPPTDLDCALERIVIDIFNSMSVRRVRLRGLVLSYGRLIPSDNQLNLEFARDRTLDRRKSLELAMDKIRGKYGVETIGPATC